MLSKVDFDRFWSLSEKLKFRIYTYMDDDKKEAHLISVADPNEYRDESNFPDITKNVYIAELLELVKKNCSTINFEMPQDNKLCLVVVDIDYNLAKELERICPIPSNNIADKALFDRLLQQLNVKISIKNF